jgi:hypothetical protein
MGRSKKVNTDTIQDSVDIEKLVAENQRLLQQVEELGKVSEGMDPIAATYLKEVDVIKKSARVESDKIIIKDFADHRNVSLWTKWGKRIGPLHQSNALAALQRFFAVGIYLSATMPTKEQIDAYNESPEGKKRIAEFNHVREIKDESKKRGNMEKMMKQMMTQYGITMETLTGLLSPEKIKSVKEGIALSKGA